MSAIRRLIAWVKDFIEQIYWAFAAGRDDL